MLDCKQKKLKPMQTKKVIITGEENGNPLQYPCLENPMDREAWWATVHGVTKSQTRLSDFTLKRKKKVIINNNYYFLAHNWIQASKDFNFLAMSWLWFPQWLVLWQIHSSPG